MSSGLHRVGYWWSEKKSRKINLKDLTQVFRSSGLDLVKIDLERPLDLQGPFAAIVHKLSDIIVQAQRGDPQCSAIYSAFQKYQETHPNVAVIDPFLNIEKLLDRYRQYKIVDCNELCDEGDVFVPAYVEMTTLNVLENLAKMKNAGIDFPIVSKPSISHGGSLSHQMSLIFNAEGLKDIRPPCVAQQFVQHNAVLYKLFVLGQQYVVMERPSLKNFVAGDQSTIFFDSNDISKPHSASALTEPEEEQSPVVCPAKPKLDKIVTAIHEQVGLDLCGIDVIVDNRTGRLAIIDVNVFPGPPSHDSLSSYNDVDCYYSLLCNLVLQKIHQKESGCLPEPYAPSLINAMPSPGVRNGHKFTFDSPRGMPVIPSNCYCCPVSEKCSNASELEQGDLLARNGEYESIHFNTDTQKQNGADDSGIETSDSCDEKKNKPNIPRSSAQLST